MLLVIDLVVIDNKYMYISIYFNSYQNVDSFVA